MQKRNIKQTVTTKTAAPVLDLSDWEPVAVSSRAPLKENARQATITKTEITGKNGRRSYKYIMRLGRVTSMMLGWEEGMRLLAFERGGHFLLVPCDSFEAKLTARRFSQSDAITIQSMSFFVQVYAKTNGAVLYDCNIVTDNLGRKCLEFWPAEQAEEAQDA